MLTRDFTPNNELRYLQIANEAIEDGHTFAFTLGGEPYADKPPLYLWIVILSKLLLGKHSMFFLGLFSIIPAFIVIWLMDRWAGVSKPVDRISVAFMMMTTAMFLGATVILRMDMLMTMFIVLALYSFWQLYEGTRKKKLHEILLPVWIFLALFSKGPVGLLMPPLAILCFLIRKRQLRQAGRYLGWKTWGIIAVLCALWFTGVYLDGGKEYLNNLLFHQTMGRAVNSFHHKEPFWHYLVVIWYVAAPYMFVLVGSVLSSYLSHKDEPRSDKELLFRGTVVSTFIMLSISSGKLAIYLVPILPFLVLLFVEVLKRTGWEKWMTWSLAVPVILVMVILLGGLAVLFFGGSIPKLADLLQTYSFALSPMVKFALSIFFIGFALALVYLFKGKPNLSLIFIGASMLLAVYSASSVVPQLNEWIGYGPLCKTISPEERVITVHMHRPLPMEVYLGRKITDYGKDFQAFMDAEMEGRSPGDAPFVLLTRTKRFRNYPELKEFAESRPHWIVGPYCAVVVDE